eukprot:CAMPEP_0184370368 /NCGR_PEP_ID=MMETSP1089-20130417/162782_1 /TAXON_ID=38269 ORGANISM="Gloeochaete wittrockiana, Strain SAG46.84" /NCGR_SAMPLE_ID=MMETSP1089 /ASSEMBLY_ACC=CAM_ASM_000445 /LENGTH=94 /DNA_ID=CAMNT_0026712959 /DNA_START=582 /DNA_END=863 /DNA_ORIENTATION=+
MKKFRKNVKACISAERYGPVTANDKQRSDTNMKKVAEHMYRPAQSLSSLCDMCASAMDGTSENRNHCRPLLSCLAERRRNLSRRSNLARIFRTS